MSKSNWRQTTPGQGFCSGVVVFGGELQIRPYIYFGQLSSANAPGVLIRCWTRVPLVVVEAPREELNSESIDNRLCDEVVQHSACASLGTKAQQKTPSARVESKRKP